MLGLHRRRTAQNRPLILARCARPQVAFGDAEVFTRHADEALDEVLRAIERVLEDNDLKALGIAQMERQLVDQDAVKDARVFVAHQRGLH